MGLFGKVFGSLFRPATIDVVQQKALVYKGGMRLKEAEVDIMFIVKNNQVAYVNNESDHLFLLDRDGDKKLDGRIVNMVFTGQFDNSVIEVFVAFDDSDSYSMFTSGVNRDERLNYVCKAIFKYFADNKIEDVFSFTQEYSSQFFYTFKLYQKDARYFMANNAGSQAYLIDDHSIKRGSLKEIHPYFWG